ncbi:hypothetical protein [Pedobacter sp.]
MKTITALLLLIGTVAVTNAQDNYWREQNMRKDEKANADKRLKEIQSGNSKGSPGPTGNWNNVGQNIANFLNEKREAEAAKTKARIEADKEWLEKERIKKSEENVSRLKDENRRKNSPVVTQKYTDGAVYVGQMYNNDGKKYGKGKLTYANGDVFEGEFANDKIFDGKYYFANGDTKEGQFWWRNAIMKYTWKNGNIYEGQFIDNKRTGLGKYTLVDGTTQEGWYEDGKITHYAKIIYGSNTTKGKKGDIYEGKIKNGLKHGRGRYTHANGKVDDGYWFNGEYIGENPPAGEPKMLFVDELKEGKFAEGHYKAEINTPEGTYVGIMFNNKKNGKGKMTYPNGEFYEGEWKDDEKTIGIEKRSDGTTKYEGGWKNGAYYGWGSTFNKKGNKEQKIGYWIQGKYVGDKENFEKLINRSNR